MHRHVPFHGPTSGIRALELGIYEEHRVLPLFLLIFIQTVAKTYLFLFQIFIEPEDCIQEQHTQISVSNSLIYPFKHSKMSPVVYQRIDLLGA